jgi:hypothetical protein
MPRLLQHVWLYTLCTWVLLILGVESLAWLLAHLMVGGSW